MPDPKPKTHHRPVVVLTRDAAGNRAWAAALRARGLTPFSAPMIQIAPTPLTPALAETLSRLPDFDWLVFTSARGVRSFAHLAAAANIDLATAPPVAAVGPATAAAARSLGLQVKFTARPATAAGLAETLGPAAGRRLLLARTSLIGPIDPAAALTRRGAIVTELTTYETKIRTTPHPALEHLLARPERIRCLVFASPSAVHGCTTSVSPAPLNIARELPVVTLGPTTGSAARAAGFTHLHQAAAPSLENLIAAVIGL